MARVRVPLHAETTVELLTEDGQDLQAEQERSGNVPTVSNGATIVTRSTQGGQVTSGRVSATRTPKPA